MRKLLVRDLMTREVFSLGGRQKLTALYRLLEAEHLRHVPVVGDDGELTGLLTPREMLRGALFPAGNETLSRRREALGRRTVAEIRIAEVETIGPDRSVADAVQIMLDNEYGCLPVVEAGRIVGILTEADLVKCLAGMIPGVRVPLTRRMERPRGGPRVRRGTARRAKPRELKRRTA